jgi:hypothetical protein
MFNNKLVKTILTNKKGQKTEAPNIDFILESIFEMISVGNHVPKTYFKDGTFRSSHKPKKTDHA